MSYYDGDDLTGSEPRHRAPELERVWGSSKEETTMAPMDSLKKLSCSSPTQTKYISRGLEINKKSAASDEYHVKVFKLYFADETLGDFSRILIERFKTDRLKSKVRGSEATRRPSTVNREIACLSKILSMAVIDVMLPITRALKSGSSARTTTVSAI